MGVGVEEVFWRNLGHAWCWRRSLPTWWDRGVQTWSKGNVMVYSEACGGVWAWSGGSVGVLGRHPLRLFSGSGVAGAWPGLGSWSSRLLFSTHTHASAARTGCCLHSCPSLFFYVRLNQHSRRGRGRPGRPEARAALLGSCGLLGMACLVLGGECPVTGRCQVWRNSAAWE